MSFLRPARPNKLDTMPSNTISPVLDFIKDRIINFSGTPDSVSLGNVGVLGDEEFRAPNFSKIFISVLKIDEERLAGNPNVYVRQDTEAEYSKLVNAHKYFSLTLLFAACSNNDRYSEALQRLERVLECFQEQHIYEIPLPGDSEDLRIMLELQNFDINQQNQLWSILGGKYFPSVIYKVKMIPILSIEKEDGYGVIERIRVDLLDKPAEDGLVIETSNDLTTT